MYFLTEFSDFSITTILPLFLCTCCNSKLLKNKNTMKENHLKHLCFSLILYNYFDEEQSMSFLIVKAFRNILILIISVW